LRCATLEDPFTIERVPAGTPPEFAWVKDDIRRRLVLWRRKQMYARHVERLRNQPRSNGALEEGL
jgi:hypothetical protein